MESGPIGPKVYDPIVLIVLIVPAASIPKGIGQGLNQNLSGCFLNRRRKRQQVQPSPRAFRIC